MAGVVELRLADLYREGNEPAPLPGSSTSVQPYQVREMEIAVRAAMRSGRVTMEVGREELRLLALCFEALGDGGGVRSVPVSIHPEPLRVRPKRGPKGESEKARQKKARRKNRRKKR